MASIARDGLGIPKAGTFEPHQVQNPDGSKRTVMVGVNISDGKSFTNAIQDSGPNSAAQASADRVAAAMKPLGARNQGDREKLFNPSTKLYLTTPDAHYRGEDGPGGAVFQNVKYLTGSERDSKELVVRDGLLVNKVTGERFNTGDKSDGAIYVIDSQGRMYASTENQLGVFHHTSFTGGEPVASAGHVVVKDGKLLHINNASGHYRPDVGMLQQGVEVLADRGLDMGEVRIVRFNADNKNAVEQTDVHGNVLGNVAATNPEAMMAPDVLRNPLVTPPASTRAPVPSPTSMNRP